jgi:hypothetical protein
MDLHDSTRCLRSQRVRLYFTITYLELLIYKKTLIVQMYFENFQNSLRSLRSIYSTNLVLILILLSIPEKI